MYSGTELSTDLFLTNKTNSINTFYLYSQRLAEGNIEDIFSLKYQYK